MKPNRIHPALQPAIDMVSPSLAKNNYEDEAWKRIAALAEEQSMILQAYGGVMILAHPDEQRRNKGTWDCAPGMSADCLAKTHAGMTRAQSMDAAERGE